MVRVHDVGSVPNESSSQALHTNNPNIPPSNTPTPPHNPIPPPRDHLGTHFERTEQPRHSGRVRVESAYIKSLRDGAGTTDGRSTDLPRGMQPAPAESNLVAELGMVGEEDGEMDEDDEEVSAMMAGVAAIESSDPTTVKEACKRTDWPKWEEAINKELTALEDACTWSVVEQPANINVVGCKWVF